MSITYEANLNCDGKDCKTRPVTSLYKRPDNAKYFVLKKAKNLDWIFIRKNKHYCPDCAEGI